MSLSAYLLEGQTIIEESRCHKVFVEESSKYRLGFLRPGLLTM